MNNSVEKSFNVVPCKAMYSTEAYYSCEDYLIPMGDFATELLATKTENDIELICNKYHFTHPSYSPCARPDIYRMNRKNPWRFKASDDFVPSFASWLLNYINTIAACLQLYAICLPIARGETKKYDCRPF